MPNRRSDHVGTIAAKIVCSAFGFFAGRLSPDYGIATASRGALIEYVNVPPIIGMIVSDGKASLRELQNDFSLQDAYDLAEIILVDSYNRAESRKKRA